LEQTNAESNDVLSAYGLNEQDAFAGIQFARNTAAPSFAYAN
jgi:hypothetical protein